MRNYIVKKWLWLFNDIILLVAQLNGIKIYLTLDMGP